MAESFLDSDYIKIEGIPIVFTPKQMERLKKQWALQWSTGPVYISKGPPGGITEKEVSNIGTYTLLGIVAFITYIFFARK